MAALIHVWGVRQVCTLSGDDAYSAGGVQAFSERGAELGLVLQTRVTFVTGTNNMKEHIQVLIDNKCSVVIFFAQTADMKTAFNAADRAGFTAAQRGVQWILSETSLQFMGVCPDLALCERVLQGGIVLSPGMFCMFPFDQEEEILCSDYIPFHKTFVVDFGPLAQYPDPVTSFPLRYQAFADRWHAQPTVMNTSEPLSTDGCDSTTDDFGTQIWQLDPDGGADPSVFNKMCTALNFSDYDRAQASLYKAEAGGDSMISTYTTLSYDAAWAVFFAIHCAIHGCEGSHDKTTTFIRHSTSVTARGVSCCLT